jgi:hypothetical protein
MSGRAGVVRLNYCMYIVSSLLIALTGSWRLQMMPALLEEASDVMSLGLRMVSLAVTSLGGSVPFKSSLAGQVGM